LTDAVTTPRRSLRRAAIALAAISLAWTAALLLGPPSADSSLGDGRIAWLIPLGAAALSLLCFRQAQTFGAEAPSDDREETTHD